jgi:hypothetical protein
MRLQGPWLVAGRRLESSSPRREAGYQLLGTPVPGSGLTQPTELMSELSCSVTASAISSGDQLLVQEADAAAVTAHHLAAEAGKVAQQVHHRGSDCLGLELVRLRMVHPVPHASTGEW